MWFKQLSRQCDIAPPAAATVHFKTFLKEHVNFCNLECFNCGTYCKCMLLLIPLGYGSICKLSHFYT